MNLAELQRAFYRHVAGLWPQSGGARLGLSKAINGDRRLSARGRLLIYTQAYHYRLLSILKEEYPATLKQLGDRRFSAMVKNYLAAFPPRHPSVYHAGQSLARFVSRPGAQYPPYIGALTALERGLIEVFHAADAPTLTREALLAVSPKRWPSLRLTLHPAHQLLKCRWRVGELIAALAHPGPSGPPVRQACTYLIWRQDYIVYFREITRAEKIGLTTVSTGKTLAQVCAAIANSEGEHQAVAAAHQMLDRWLEDGLLAAFRLRQ